MKIKATNLVYWGCLAVLSVSLITAQAQSFTVNFDTAGDLANKFNIYMNSTVPATNPPSGSPYSQSLTGGVGGSGLVNIAAPATAGITNDSTAIYKNTSFDFSLAGETITVSAYVNIIGPTETGNRLLHLGFANSPFSGLNGNAGLAFTGFRLNPTAIGSTVFSPQWQTKTAAGGTVNTAGGTNVTLTLGDWYKLSVSFANLGSGSMQASGFVQDFGVNGLTPGTSFNFSPVILNSLDIATNNAVYAAFRTFQADGAGGLDNFAASEVLPEPGTMALGGLGLGTLLMVRRRQGRG
jgi:hypothetical protein